MTNEQYVDKLCEITRESDQLIQTVEELAKNARSELVQRTLSDRKNVLAANMQKKLEALDVEYNKSEEAEIVFEGPTGVEGEDGPNGV